MINVVGMCPSSSGGEAVRRRPSLALTGSTGRRLAALMGLEWTAYLARTRRVNLLPSEPDRWPRGEAMRAAKHLGPRLFGPTVFLGREVAAAFELVWSPRLICVETTPYSRAPRAVPLLVVPHPSGRSRWYNDTENRDRASSALRDLLRRTAP